MDIVGAGCALLMLSLVMLALAVIVRSHNGGPVNSAEERTGLDGTALGMLKFRSVFTDAETRRDDLIALNESAEASCSS